MYELRSYQQEAVNELRQGFKQRHKRQVLAVGTGSGKTVIASYLIHAAAQKGHKSLFIVDKIVLIDQAVRHLQALGLRVGVMQGENTNLHADDEVVVASIQTLRSRKAPHDIYFVVIDEVHVLHRAHIALIEQWTALPFIGLSATPLRQDLGKYFTNLVRGPSIKQLTDEGYLVPVKAFGPSADKLKAILGDVGLAAGDFANSQLSQALNQKELIGDIIETWKRQAGGKRTLVFGVDIAHSRSICDDFLSEGILAAHIDKSTTQEEREAIFEGFKNGDITVLTSVNVLSIGFDMPVAEVGILARPTLSLALHIQQVGRLLRPAEGKEHALILDHAGNIARHGLPTDFIVPDLNNLDRKATHAKRNDVVMKPCGACGYMLEPGQTTCPECGVDRPTRKSEVHFIDGELVAVDSNKPVRQWDVDDELGFFLELKFIQEQHDYSDGWASVNFKNRFGRWPPWKWNDLPAIPASAATARWVKSKQIAWGKSKQRQVS